MELKGPQEIQESKSQQQVQKVISTGKKANDSNSDDLSEGSHGELCSEDIVESHGESMPNHFPWSISYRDNYLRQRAMHAR